MHCRIITVSQKVPKWLQEAYFDYVKRFPPSFQLDLIEVPLEKRTNNTLIQSVKQKEGERLLAQTKPSHHVVTLDIKGNMWSTEELAKNMQTWFGRGLHVDFMIGGPDGLAPACYERANQTWSLSRLTFPHHLVRLLLIEQLYRAHTILIDHPYHRG